MARVSVVIPARDAAASLPATLASLDRQTAAAEAFEVIVVDDGSSDATAAIVAAHPRARLVRNASPLGDAARNLGVEAATGDVLAFVDADCLAAEDWIERGLERMDRGEDDLIGGRIEAPLPDRPGIATLLDVARSYDQERYVREGHAASGNLWVRRTTFLDLGGFDPRLRAGADTELTSRAVARGLRLGYAADVVVRHPPLRRLRQLSRRAYRDGQSAAQRGQSQLLRRRAQPAYISAQDVTSRLHAAGRRPGALQRAVLSVTTSAFVRAPLLAGNLVGLVRGRPLSADAEQRKAAELAWHDVAWEHDVRGGFDRFYDVTRASRDRLERLVLERSPGHDVLEIGCGDRPLAYRIAKAGGRVTAIDLSPVAVRMSVEKAAELGVEASFAVMDVERLEFPDASFDLVCASGVLHHLDLASALAEITRVLRPQGSAVFVEPLGHNPAINLFRALTPHARTPDEHPLRTADIDLLAGGFHESHPTFHHLLGLAGFPFRGTRAFGAVLGVLDRIDASLFHRSEVLRSWAWLVVLDLRRPRR